MTMRARIAALLRDEIAEGAWAEGARLPAEAALAARFGINRHTVRAALSDLAAEGLVRARRGAGTFVAGRPADYALGRRVRFHQNLAGRAPAKRLLSLERRAARPREAEALALDPGAPVVAYEGLSLAEGRPIATFSSVFPALDGLVEALRDGGSVTRALAACGVGDHVRRESRIDARAADPVRAGLLELAVGAPLIRVASLNVDGSGRPVEAGRTWFAAERVTLTVDHA